MNDSRFDQKQGDNTPIYDDPFEEENRKTRVRFFVMGGIGIIFCLLAMLGLPGVLRKSNLPIAAEFFPSLTSTVTRTPTRTPTPNIAATLQEINRLGTEVASQAKASGAATTWRVLSSEPFDNNGKEWPTGNEDGEYASITRDIKDGKYIWQATAHKGFVARVNPPAEYSIKDFYATIECKVTGETSAEYGLIFRKSGAQNYYFFEVSDSGEYALFLRYNNEWVTIIDWTKSSTIKKSETNRITVIGEGSHFIFLINDSFVADAIDERVKAGSIFMAISLSENENAIFIFDNFEIRAP